MGTITRTQSGGMSRRQFLIGACLAACSGSLLAACAPSAPPAPTAAPKAAAPTSAPAAPATQAPVPTLAPAAQVAPPTAAPAPPTPAPAAKPAGPAPNITLGMSQDLTYIDPSKNSTLSDLNTLFINVYDPLLMRQPNGAFGPWLAQSWQMPSPTEWVFNLTPNVKFHNGEPLDAAAVKFTFERYLDPGVQRYAPMVGMAERAEIIDPLTVKLVTKKPFGAFLEILWQMSILPPKYLAEVGDAGFDKKPIGSGAYKFVEWTKGSQLVLERNEEYWKGLPAYGRATFKFMPEVAIRQAALKTGEIDVMYQLPPDAVTEVESSATLRVASVETPRVLFFIFHPNSPAGTGKPLQDVRVRKAINLAVNRDAIIKTIMANQAKRVTQLYSPQTFGYDASVQPEYPYDPEMAKKLIAEAGFSSGFPLDMDVPTGGNPIKPLEVGQAVAADLERVGIQAKIRTVDAAGYFKLRDDKATSPMFMWTWLAFDADESLWGNLYSKSPWFFMAGHDQEIDDLIDKERNTTDSQVRIPVFKRLQERLAQDVPHLAMYQQKDIFGVSKKVKWDPALGGFVHLVTASPA